MKRALIALALALAAGGQGEGASRLPPTSAARAASSAALAPTNLPAVFDCRREQSFTPVSAHRGGPAPVFAGNAIPAFTHTPILAPAVSWEVFITYSVAGAARLRHGAPNTALSQRGAELEFDALGGRRSCDARFAGEHREQYGAFADVGVQLISTGRPHEALADLDTHDNV